MTKDEAVEELKRRGFDAHKMDGIVMVRTADTERQTYSAVKRAIKEMGYNASWGVYATDNSF